MKDRTKGFLAGVACTALTLSLAATAFAAAGSVSFNSVNLRFHGQQISAKGENYTIGTGASVPASILYTDENGGGTTYLPIARISELLGTEIGWDGSTGSVRIGEEPSAVNGEGDFVVDEVKTINVPLMKIGEDYYMWPHTINGMHYDLITTTSGEKLLFADIRVARGLSASWDINMVLRLALLESFDYQKTDNPNIKGELTDLQPDVNLPGIIVCGEDAPTYVTATQTQQNIWMEYNGKRVYNQHLSPTQTATVDGVRYRGRAVCINDLLKFFEIDKEIEIGKYMGDWYICVQ